MKYFNVLGLFVAMLISATTFGAHLSDNLLVSARLSGAQEVPAVTTSATGVAGFSINSAKDSVCIDIIVVGLSGPITGIHIHDGVAGTNGGVVFNLGSFVSGNRIQTVITGADLTAEIMGKLLSSEYYLNVHTAANPNGEIRGQLKLETDMGLKANLDASQQVHTSTSNATGLGAFTVSLTGDYIEVKLLTTGLSGAITAAHLHTGAAGTAGPVALNLSGLIDGNAIIGGIDLTTVTGLIDDLQAGNIYVNIHTAANPDGEIRGQLTTNMNLKFDGMMDVAQEPHVVTGSMGRGITIVEVSPKLDEIFTYALFDGLSGAATAAHLHEGGAGVSGGVLVNVTPGISGSSISSTNALDISTDLAILNEMLEGNVYLNIHTTLNAAGEIRGQLSRIVREGYTVSLDGGQEVPVVTTSAEGAGIVSIDRNRSNAHYMIVVNGLSDNLTGAHFHNEAVGANGGVVYNITPSFGGTTTNDGAFGYWTDLDMATPFTAANEEMFRNNEIYVNIHTVMNPNGEIRGQVAREGVCSNPTITVRKDIFESVTIFPNPVTDRFTLSMELTEAFDGNLFITNTLGQVVKSDNLPTGTDLSNHQVDVTGLAKGMYFLTIKNDTYSYTIRFIKE